MKKIIVIGCPGSGKSTFSKLLHKAVGIPLIHLDMLYWNKDKTTVDRPIFLNRLTDALQGDRWIIDGNYASTMEMRLKECDTVFFLDYATEVCLDGIRTRRGSERSDIPWVETEEDKEFTQYVADFNRQMRPQILTLLKAYADKSIYTFKNRQEADDYLSRLMG